MDMTPVQVEMENAIWEGSAETTETLAGIYKKLAEKAKTPGIKATWEMAADIAIRWAEQARAKVS